MQRVAAAVKRQEDRGEDGLGMQTNDELIGKSFACPPVSAVRYSNFCVPDKDIICENNVASGWYRVKFKL